MSEFKFACPICGQHMTADSNDTGSPITCPTCYRKIVVPQAPATEDSKFVLSASEVNKPRPLPTAPTPETPAALAEKKTFPFAWLIALALVGLVGTALFIARERLFHSRPPAPEVLNVPPTNAPPFAVQPDYAGTNRWTLDLSGASYPETPVSGSIHHRAFVINRASLVGSNLMLRSAWNSPAETGVTISFFNRQPAELSGKTAVVKVDDPVSPLVVIHWNDPQRVYAAYPTGYVMKVEFGILANGAIPGKIFLCTPDESKSWIAGTFNAVIRQPFGPPPRRP